MADDTDTTRPGEAEAVEAALRAFRHAKDPDGIVFPTFERRMQETVAAAYPVIAAAVREQVAQDIEAMDEPDWHTGGTLGAEEMGWSWARDDAARVARGGR